MSTDLLKSYYGKIQLTIITGCYILVATYSYTKYIMYNINHVVMCNIQNMDSYIS